MERHGLGMDYLRAVEKEKSSLWKTFDNVRNL